MGASECNEHKAKPRTRAREDARPRSRQKVRKIGRLSVDENIIDEFQVSSKTTDNCVEPTVIRSIVVKKKLSQSEVDRMVQEAETSRNEDEVNESKHEAESGLEEFRVWRPQLRTARELCQ